MPNNSIDKRITFGVILIFIGGLFLLNTFDILDFRVSKIIFSGPFILFMVGILLLINSNKKALGSIFAGVGLIWLLPRIFPEVNFNYGPGLVIPVLLICLGIYIILKHSQKKTTDEKWTMENIKKDMVDDVSVFGGGNKVISSDNFRGGSITAIFGGSEIDLTNCKLAEGTNILDVVAIFGGTTIIVPRDWNVQLNITPLFGGFSNKTSKIPGIEIDKSKILIVKGLAIFGGGEVKTVYN